MSSNVLCKIKKIKKSRLGMKVWVKTKKEKKIKEWKSRMDVRMQKEKKIEV